MFVRPKSLGKFLRGSVMTTTVPASRSPSRLSCIFDPGSKLCFLVDTGAEVSVLPPTKADKMHQESTKLRAANGTTIAIYGRRFLQLNLKLRRDFPWQFIIADVSIPIIGADFLSHYGLLVDIRTCSLLDSTTSLRTTGTISNSLLSGISFVHPQSVHP